MMSLLWLSICWILALYGIREIRGFVVVRKTCKIAIFDIASRNAHGTRINLRSNPSRDDLKNKVPNNRESVTVLETKRKHSKNQPKSLGKPINSKKLTKNTNKDSTDIDRSKEPYIDRSKEPYFSAIEDINIYDDYESSSGTILSGSSSTNVATFEHDSPKSLLWKTLILCFLPFGFSIGGYQLAKYCTEHIVAQFSSTKQDPSSEIYRIEEKLFVVLKNLVVVVTGITSGLSAILGIVGLFSLVYAISTEAGRK